MKKIKIRDIEKNYPKSELIKKLRRLADSLEQGKKFSLSVAGVKINIPKGAVINIEHERSKTTEEVEFQLKWKLD